MTWQQIRDTIALEYKNLPKPVITKHLRLLAKRHKNEVNNLPLNDTFKLVESFLKRKNRRFTIIGFQLIDYVHRKFSEDTFQTFDRWVRNYVRDWWDCDDFMTHAMMRLYMKHPELWEQILDWTTHEAFGVRRCAAVVLVVPARKGAVDINRVFEVCDTLLLDDHYLVQKGYGWLLKEASKKYKDEVMEYLENHVKDMPRTAFRYAVEKLPKDGKKATNVVVGDLMINPTDLKSYEQYIIDHRRDFHKHPERGFEETRTSAIIEQELTRFGYDLITGVGKTGIVATLNKDHPGKTIALRADIDALPMQEENDVVYKSTIDGMMHACGHDTHTAILLGVAKYYSEHKDTLQGTLKLIFQAAEEGPMPGGGIAVVKGGYIDDCDAVFGLHITTQYQFGEIVIKKGAAMAAPDEFSIVVNGQGTHASAPHTGSDPIVAASAIIQSIQSIITRQINPLKPAVITVASIHGGSAFNIIPDKVTLTGTIRTLHSDVRTQIFDLLTKTATTTAKAYGCEADVDITESYPPLYNDDTMSDMVMDVAKQVVDPKQANWATEPVMGGEDFAYYLQKKPGAFFWLGGRPLDETTMYYNHNPKFDVEEKAFLIGLAMHINIVNTFLQ